MEFCIVVLVPAVIVFAFYATLFPTKDKSQSGVFNVQSKGWGCAFVVLGMAYVLCAFGLRIDKEEGSAHGQLMAILVGGLVAVAFLLTRLAVPPPRHRSWKYVTILGVVLCWIGASGLPLVLIAVAKVHSVNSQVFITRERVRDIPDALTKYRDDCGAYPPDELGLKALSEDPGVECWKGPYLKPDIVTDRWGNLIHYAERDGKLVVWSNGRDGISGTEDDVTDSRE